MHKNIKAVSTYFVQMLEFNTALKMNEVMNEAKCKRWKLPDTSWHGDVVSCKIILPREVLKVSLWKDFTLRNKTEKKSTKMQGSKYCHIIQVCKNTLSKPCFDYLANWYINILNIIF